MASESLHGPVVGARGVRSRRFAQRVLSGCLSRHGSRDDVGAAWQREARRSRRFHVITAEANNAFPIVIHVRLSIIKAFLSVDWRCVWWTRRRARRLDGYNCRDVLLVG